MFEELFEGIGGLVGGAFDEAGDLSNAVLDGTGNLANAALSEGGELLDAVAPLAVGAAVGYVIGEALFGDDDPEKKSEAPKARVKRPQKPETKIAETKAQAVLPGFNLPAQGGFSHV